MEKRRALIWRDLIFVIDTLLWIPLETLWVACLVAVSASLLSSKTTCLQKIDKWGKTKEIFLEESTPFWHLSFAYAITPCSPCPWWSIISPIRASISYRGALECEATSLRLHMPMMWSTAMMHEMQMFVPILCYNRKVNNSVLQYRLQRKCTKASKKRIRNTTIQTSLTRTFVIRVFNKRLFGWILRIFTLFYYLFFIIWIYLLNNWTPRSFRLRGLMIKKSRWLHVCKRNSRTTKEARLKHASKWISEERIIKWIPSTKETRN